MKQVVHAGRQPGQYARGRVPGADVDGEIVRVEGDDAILGWPSSTYAERRSVATRVPLATLRPHPWLRKRGGDGPVTEELAECLADPPHAEVWVLREEFAPGEGGRLPCPHCPR